MRIGMPHATNRCYLRANTRVLPTEATLMSNIRRILAVVALLALCSAVQAGHINGTNPTGPSTAYSPDGKYKVGLAPNAANYLEAVS